GAAPGVGPPLVDPLVVERAGRVVVPEVVRVRLAVSEPDTGIGQNAEEEREPERSRRGAAVTLPLEPCGGEPVPADSCRPRPEDAPPPPGGAPVSGERGVGRAVGRRGKGDELARGPRSSRPGRAAGRPGRGVW